MHTADAIDTVIKNLNNSDAQMKDNSEESSDDFKKKFTKKIT